jgi:hypothetical protein
MSAIGLATTKLNNLADLKDSKPAASPENKEESRVSALQLSEKVDLTGTAKGISATTVSFAEPKAEPLPEVKVVKDGNFTFYTNAYGKKITVLDTKDKGISYNTFSDEGLAIILKDNKGKRDVLVFSAMTDKVPSNSAIYDNYFQANQECSSNVSFEMSGKCSGKIYFDKNQNIVIEINEKNKIVLDGKDAKTVIEGPFNIKFNPGSDGSDFRVDYTGFDKFKRFTSRGGKIQF